ncbi:MAG: sensor histidine kinase, partial [Planctomycetaceae bacterium]
MSRSRFTWLAFLLCLAVVSAAMGWVTHVTLELERAEAQAARQSENERLALWRMESALVPLIAQESARPHYAYLAFHRPEHAYSKMLAPIVPGEVQVPSELLAYESPFIVLHFQYGPQGEATSPQVPTSNLRDLAEAKYTTPDRIERYGQRLEFFCAACSPATLSSALDSERTAAAVTEP